MIRLTNIRLGGKQHTKGCYVLLSFLFPFLILILALVALHVEPFGEHNLMLSDGRYYINNLAYFGRLLKGDASWLYSFENGLGANEWSILSWGQISIGGLLSVFATLETLPVWFSWITLVNMSLCGVSMYILLTDLRGTSLSNLIFSTTYALIGFNVAYCYHFIFFIGPQMLPLLLLGLVWIIRGKSPLLYIISLAICTFLNFYFGFILCVASFIVFLVFIIGKKESLYGKRKVLFGRYLVSSVLGGLLPTVMWLPALKAFSGGGRLNQTVLTDFKFSENMPFIQIFSKFFSGAISFNEEVNGLPNIFCGILVLALVILFFLDQKTPIRRKRMAGVVLGFYLLTFYIAAFTLVMHGGTVTNWFPFRYSFVFSCLMILLAFEEFMQLDEITLKDTKKCGIVLLVSIIIVFSTKYEFITAGSLLVDFGCLMVMWLGFYIYKTKPEKAPKRALTLLLLLMVSVNLYANFTISIYKLRDVEKDIKAYNGYILESGAMTEALKQTETGFFRMEKDFSETGNLGLDPQLYGYHGVSHSGPTDRGFIHKNLNRIGVNWYDMRHWYEAGIPAATDTLLGLKYIISNGSDLEAEKGYSVRLETTNNTIYENPDALSVAVLSDNPVKDVVLSSNPFDNLNDIWKNMTGGNEDIFIPEDDITFILHNNTDGQSITSSELRTSRAESESGDAEEPQTTAYIEFEFTAKRDGTVYRFDSSVPDSEYGKILPSASCCGVYKAGDKVTGICPTNAEYLPPQMFTEYCSNLRFAYEDDEVLAKYAGILNGRDISFNTEKDTCLTGSFTAEADQIILFTIPWDEGWTCYIDGQKVDIDKTWDLFMSVSVPEGEHTYEMKFFPAWMNYGIIISCAAFAGLIVFLIIWKKKSKVSAALIEQISDPKYSQDIGGVVISETITAAEMDSADI